MARRTTPMDDDANKTEPEATEISVMESPDGWEWDTVAEESPTRILFDTKGESFIGQYIGMDHIEQEPDKDGKDQSFDLYIFRGRDGVLYSVNKSYKLEEAMQKVAEGDWTRITYVKDIPTKRGLNPMMDLRVDVRK